MEDIGIIDNFIDSREFRNYIQAVLLKHGYFPVTLDDARLSDDDPTNDNDMLAKKDNVMYTVQTYLNKKITMREIEETVQDMEREKVGFGIIISNDEVSVNAKEAAARLNITIIDNEKIEEYIEVMK
ncbi:MAG: restriction endonuclease [Bacilli bacterium]|nr:restriction endonuclease [Bacilli bacterium]